TVVGRCAGRVRPPGGVRAESPGRSRGGGEPVVPAAVAAGLLPPVRGAGWLRCRMTAAARAGRGGGILRGSGSVRDRGILRGRGCVRSRGSLRGSAARKDRRDTGLPGGDRAE